MSQARPAVSRAATTAVAAGFAALALGWLLALQRAGFADSNAAVLTGRALLGSTGHLELRNIITAYPPLTYVPLIAADKIVGHPAWLAACLLSALLAGGLAAAWWRAFRRSGYGPAAATASVALLVLNPVTLRAFAEGPQTALLLWAMWWFARALFGLRIQGAINDLILLSVVLAALPFISLHGALFALAAVPFLLLAVPPQLLQRSFASTYLLLLFPALFSLFSFALICWIFLGDPLGFVTADAGWPRLGEWSQIGRAALGVILVMPVLSGLIIRAGRRRPTFRAGLALALTLATGAALVLLIEPDQPLGLALAPCIPAAAAAATAWPVERRRGPVVAALLLLGLILSFGPLVRDASPVTLRLISAVKGDPGASVADSDALLAQFLAGRRNIMFDAASHPEVIARAGSTEGLITANDERFRLMLLRLRPDGEWLVTHAPDPSASLDALSRAFPALHDAGTPGYRLAYDQGGWRVWQRLPSKDPHHG